MFETQKSENKSKSGEMSINIRTHASPKVGQDQVFRGVSLLCLHAVSDANVQWKLLLVIRFMADLLRKYRGSVVIMVGRGGAEPHYVHN